MVSFMLLPLKPQVNRYRYPVYKRLVSPRALLNVMVKNLLDLPGIEPLLLALSLVAISDSAISALCASQLMFH
jgi:hypothetical protein